jgi:hypothetical protein
MTMSWRFRPARVLGCALVAAVAASLMLWASHAQASAGAYNVLLAEVYEVGAKRLQSQVKAFPDVAKVDLVNTGERTPSAAELRAYDVVVSIGDSEYLDYEAWGESLASYVDSGGIVVQSAYDTWDDSGEAGPGGRFASGGYAPFIPGDNVNDPTTLGAFDASSPLMQGIAPGSLTTATYNTLNAPAPGASVVASWADGRPAVGVKGRVVAITAFIGDDYDSPGEPAWTGNYGQLVINAARAFTPQPLTVANSNPAGGTVVSSVGGINCGSTCTAGLPYQTQVGLAAVANKGFAFAGFTGACAGTACALTMDGPKSVTANFVAFGFGKGIKRNKRKGTATIPVAVGAPGALTLSGKKIKPRSTAVAAAGTAKFRVAAKGKALKKLRKTGKVKVNLTLTFTPAGGVPSTLTKKVQLKRTIR